MGDGEARYRPRTKWSAAAARSSSISTAPSRSHHVVAQTSARARTSATRSSTDLDLTARWSFLTGCARRHLSRAAGSPGRKKQASVPWTITGATRLTPVETRFRLKVIRLLIGQSIWRGRNSETGNLPPCCGTTAARPSSEAQPATSVDRRAMKADQSTRPRNIGVDAALLGLILAQKATSRTEVLARTGNSMLGSNLGRPDLGDVRRKA